MRVKAPQKSYGLPAPADRVLSNFLDAAQETLGETLKSAVLYGSAADGKLRPTSDLNLILVLSDFVQDRMDRLREPLRTGYAAARLSVLFLLETEIKTAADAFAVKFSDIGHRHKVLIGLDPFTDLKVSRSAHLFRLRQVLFNLILRLRSQYMLRSLREEQLVLLVADAAGPLRSAAYSLLELEGRAAPSPKEALERFASSLSATEWKEILPRLSTARETRSLPAGTAGPTLFRLMELAQHLHAKSALLS